MRDVLDIVLTDTHINGAVAVCAPGLVDDDGREIQLSKTQWWLWGKLQSFAYDAQNMAGNRLVYVHFLGDMVDVDLFNRSAQIITHNVSVLRRMAKTTLSPITSMADRIFWHRGTIPHGGISGQNEELCAQDVGAEQQDGRYSAWWWLVNASDVLIESAHKTTPDGRAWTAGGSVVRLASDTVMAYGGERERVPALTLRGHTHSYKDSHDLVRGCRAITLWPWTALNEYANSVVKARPVTAIGGLLIQCQNGKYQVHKREYRIAREPAWTENLPQEMCSTKSA